MPRLASILAALLLPALAVGLPRPAAAQPALPPPAEAAPAPDPAWNDRSALPPPAASSVTPDERRRTLAQRRAALEARLAAMTPEQRAAWEARRAERLRARASAPRPDASPGASGSAGFGNRPPAAPSATMSREERLALRQRRIAEREARLARMTPEQRAAWEARRAERLAARGQGPRGQYAPGQGGPGQGIPGATPDRRPNGTPGLGPDTAGMSREERLALRQRRAAEREARLAAMTPDQRAAWEARRAARLNETPEERAARDARRPSIAPGTPAPADDQ